jgi:hypothetical protein
VILNNDLLGIDMKKRPPGWQNKKGRERVSVSSSSFDLSGFGIGDDVMVVGFVPIDYAEMFGDALREFAPGFKVSMGIDMDMTAAELRVSPPFTEEQRLQWDEVWWSLREVVEGRKIDRSKGCSCGCENIPEPE